MAADDTIVALSSGRPPAAIAVVRVSGPAALEAGAALSGPLGPPRTARLRRLRDPRDGSTIDHALTIHFPGPNSSTGEDIVEFQCHGSRAVVDSLIGALLRLDDVREAKPGEFTRRALSNGRIDLTQAEGLAELLEAETEAQRKSALRRSEGALRQRIEQWRRELLAVSAALEVAIDYSDEEDGQQANSALGPLAGLIEEMHALLEAPRIEKLRDGVRVVVAGPTNAGKSSLVNALAGQERAIVTPIAGTTRDRIEVPLAIAGIPFVLVDTAGLRDSDDEVERIGISLAEQEVSEADIVLWLGDQEQAPPDAIVIHAQVDRRPRVHPAALAVSAVSGAGLSSLKEQLAARGARIIPQGAALSLNNREALLLEQAATALITAQVQADAILAAEEVRVARNCFEQISGRAGIEDLLDALFGRFCLGK